ncbi:battenin [Microplitis mediator]|uniref:battenin n=1 Tax=Microplitis mediator TaxID=375433 RepID=UPI002552F4A1|nr:battenin [Microplitis mediator]
MDVVTAKSTVKDELGGTRAARWRNFLAFWLIGLCNNYGYVVMLSAAHDILKEKFSSPESSVTENNMTIENPRGCNEISTGAILLADILPCLLIKLTVPFLPFYVNVRVAMCVISQILGFLAVAFGTSPWITIMGVILTSFSSGLGEITILSHSYKYGRTSIAAWSSGTGGAGVAGAFSYAGFRLIMSTETTLLVMLVVPVTEAIAFWLIMTRPNEKSVLKYGISSQDDIIKVPKKTIKEKISLVPGLMPYLIPLFLVYLFEYYINQGLHELIQFDGIWLNHAEQYRWYQVDYQIGVFISRSSATFFTFNKIWLMALFQFINIVIFTTESIFFYIPSIWIVFVITFWEGLLGGASYVNTFYNMGETIPDKDLKDSLGIVSMADSLGIAIAGGIAMPVHNAICRLPRPQY